MKSGLHCRIGFSNRAARGDRQGLIAAAIHSQSGTFGRVLPSTYATNLIGVPPSDLGRECPVEIRWDVDGFAFPTAEQAVEACPVVGETELGARVVVAIDAEMPLPVVWREGVERGVVKRGHHLGDRVLGIVAGDRRRPSFLLSWTELGDEALPLHVEFHVRPRHGDMVRALQHSVLANLRHVNTEPAAHRFSDRHL